jgi:hypothetical protein
VRACKYTSAGARNGGAGSGKATQPNWCETTRKQHALPVCGGGVAQQLTHAAEVFSPGWQVLPDLKRLCILQGPRDGA